LAKKNKKNNDIGGTRKRSTNNNLDKLLGEAATGGDAEWLDSVFDSSMRDMLATPSPADDATDAGESEAAADATDVAAASTQAASTNKAKAKAKAKAKTKAKAKQKEISTAAAAAATAAMDTNTRDLLALGYVFCSMLFLPFLVCV
jgi:hypothetical protein